MTRRFSKDSLPGRWVFPVVAAAILSFGPNARIQAATITVSYTTAPGFDGTLAYLSNPNGAQPAQDRFFANIVSPQYGNGTLSVPLDFTNYITATGHGDVAIFTFGSGTFSGSEDAVLNLGTGGAALTYHITSGTGAFSGALGTLTESAQFTSLGSWIPNVPATAAILSGGGNLTLTPEPGTLGALAIGLLGGALLRKRKSS